MVSLIESQEMKSRRRIIKNLGQFDDTPTDTINHPITVTVAPEFPHVLELGKMRV